MSNTAIAATIPCRILVVDDDPSILATIAEILTDEGYAVHTAANGQEALDAVEQITPRFVLLDMRMPVLDGWGFVHALHDRGRTLPIVVMTAAQDARRWAGEIGAVATLPKPFDLPDLLGMVEQLCTVGPGGAT